MRHRFIEHELASDYLLQPQASRRKQLRDVTLQKTRFCEHWPEIAITLKSQSTETPKHGIFTGREKGDRNQVTTCSSCLLLAFFGYMLRGCARSQPPTAWVSSGKNRDSLSGRENFWMFRSATHGGTRPSLPRFAKLP